MQTSASYTLAQ